MYGAYDPGLVFVSVVVAIFASYTALDLARSLSRTKRLEWLAAGALSMGVGIWSMHFIGMLAFSLPGTPIAYDLPLLIVSVAVAIVASAVALFLVSRAQVAFTTLIAGGLAMAAAICGMHYIGMASMRMNAVIAWNWLWVAASVVIAIVASFVALHLAFGMRLDAGRRLRHTAGGVVMGVAISGMHYTAMAAAQITPSPSGGIRMQSNDLLATDGLALAVTGATVLILTMAVLASIVTRELARRAAAVQEHARLYQTAQAEFAERKAVEKVVQDQAAAMEAAIDGMAIIDEEGTYAYANSAYAHMYGYANAAQLAGREWTVVYDDVEGRRLREAAARALREQGSWRGEAEGCRQDGRTFPQEVALTALPDDAFICVTRDITERHSADQALEAQRSFLRTVLDASPSLVYAKDAAGRYTLANKALADIYGTAPDALLARTDAEMHPDAGEVSVFRNDDLEIIRGAARVSREEPLTSPITGETRWFHTEKVPLDIPGHGRQVLGISTDVTERKRIEEALLQSEAQLRQSQKMEAVGQLAGGIAHDFNNLLTVIQGNLQLALDESQPGSAARSLLDEVQEAAGRAADLTRQLLTFSRQELARPALLDPNRVVLQMERIFRRLIHEDVILENDLDDELGAIRIDEGQLQQILLNLVVNARDAIRGGGRIRIGTSRVSIEAGERTPDPLGPGAYVCLTVEDTGSGMEASTIPRIFEPFFTTKPQGSGTGLGLSTVYGIVRASGGGINVDSVPGQGSRFRVYLPEADGMRPAQESGGVSAGVARTQHVGTILVAEDEPQLQKLVARVLRKLGYFVLEADSGEQALEIAQNEARPIDLLLTDVVMGGMSGRELAERLSDVRPNMRLLFMSGYTRDEVLRRGIESASVAFLEKPFTPEELAAAVGRILH